jgi:DNA-binding transcriptional MerR regulator
LLSFVAVPFAGIFYGVDMKQLCNELNETEGHVKYWKALLEKQGLISPKKGLGNKNIFSQPEVEQFKRLKAFMNNGAVTVTQAVRLMANNANPEELYAQYKQAQRQIEVLQKKVLQLRKPVWKRLVDWLKSLLSGVLPPRTEQ